MRVTAVQRLTLFNSRHRVLRSVRRIVLQLYECVEKAHQLRRCICDCGGFDRMERCAENNLSNFK